ncbi:hypothetical protein AGMMS50267_02860 [Spirochaetia bacterium]|nr:hypothetical protein AGMMS50267_02860 [Spirochaetia bacterium]
MNPWIFWLVPPAIGAVIGYVTNAVAIKMLFRPLREIRFLGIRLPFTPGILPRQRHKLADNIGAMVERELLTPEILRERLRREDVRQSIGSSIAAYTEKLLDAPIGGLARPGAGDSGPPESPIIITLLRGVLRSDGFNALLDTLLETLIDPKRSIRDILGNEKMAVVEEQLEVLIRDALSAALPQIAGTLRPVLEDAFPQIARSIVQFLQKEEIRRELEVQGQVFLNNALLKLSVVQRLFISAGQYDKTLRDRMPEIIDDLIVQLEALLADGAIRGRLIAYTGDTALTLAAEAGSYTRMVRFASTLIRSYSDRPVGELLKKFGMEQVTDLSQRIRTFIQGTLVSETLVQETLVPETLVSETLVSGDRAAFSPPLKFEQAIAVALGRFREEHGDMRLGTLCALDAEKKGRIDALIQDKLFQIAEEQLEALLKTINVRVMVSDRIDALDMIKVERIVLDVMANQLKWINVFGGILGAVIGMVQAVFSWIMGR